MKTKITKTAETTKTTKTTITTILINQLIPHPRNTEFFDDMTGEKWKEFLESIKTRGIIEPIVITTDKTIVSGHQRVRACNELGIDQIPCSIHSYNNKDEILQGLLKTNIRQRGDVGCSAKKLVFSGKFHKLKSDIKFLTKQKTNLSRKLILLLS